MVRLRLSLISYKDTGENSVNLRFVFETSDFYSGLSIQPISQSVSHLDGILKDVETAYKVLHETVTEVSL